MGTDEIEKAAAPKQRYPWYIIFILGNEFCERFTYYGMKTVLTLYFSKVLFWSEDTTTFYYHFFSMLCYFFPVFGAWLADGLIGKFNTIFSLSIVYIIGLAVLTLSAMPPVPFDAVAGTLSGLLLIAIGTGGIKPCVAAYGADQFKPGQEAQRETFFSYFYFCINAGSLISTFVTPLLRSDVHCFNAKSCYSLAFGVPAALMAVALVCFLIGKPFYQDHKPTGSLISRVTFCICHAISNNVRGRNQAHNEARSDKPLSKSREAGTASKSIVQKLRKKISKNGSVEEPVHWLDSASDKYDAKLIADIKQLLRVLVMFLPIPMFWALFDQQGSRWTLQANKMDGRISDSYSWQPDQVQIFNPVLILIFIPFFEWVVYPIMHRFKISFRLLARMVLGMVLAGVAFIIAGFLQIALEKTLPTLPGVGMSEIRIFNANPCNLTVSGDFFPAEKENLMVGPYGMLHVYDIRVHDQALLALTAENVDCPAFSSPSKILLNTSSTQVYSVFLTLHNGQLISKQVKVTKEKPEDGNVKVTFILPFSLDTFSGDGNLTLINPNITEGKPGREFSAFVNGSGATNIIQDIALELDPGRYLVYISNQSADLGKSVMGSQMLDVRNGGVYTILFKEDSSTSQTWERYAIVEPNSLSIFWQFPQYFVITLAEVFLSVSGLSFAYSEAPESMKSVLQAAWLLTSAFGSIIVMIFSGAHLIKNQAVEFFIFAGLIIIFAAIFAVMSKYYNYKIADPAAIEMTTTNPKTKEEDKDQKLTTQVVESQ